MTANLSQRSCRRGHTLLQVFGCDVNAKGYKKPRGCGVIQGDGINVTMLAKIMDAVLDAGFSAEVTLSGVVVLGVGFRCSLVDVTMLSKIMDAVLHAGFGVD